MVFSPSPAAARGYVPLHRHEAVVREATAIAERLGQPYPTADCPVADQVAADTIWLPQPYLLGTEDQTRRAASAITKLVHHAATLTPGDQS